MDIKSSNAFNYHDFQSMQEMRKFANKDSKDEGIKVVAKQLESVFLQMVVKSMREANKAFESDIFGDQSGDLYHDMYDQQMTLSLSKGEGIGLAKIIESQLKSVNITRSNGLKS